MFDSFIQHGLIATPEARARLAEAILLAFEEGHCETTFSAKDMEHVMPAVHYVLSYPEVRLRVRHGSLAYPAAGLLLGFVRDAQRKLNDLGHPYRAEQSLWEGFERTRGEWFPENWPEIGALLDQFYRKEEIDPHFFQTAFHRLKEEGSSTNEREVLRNMLLGDWGRLIEEKRIAYQTERVDSWRDAFLEKLLAHLKSWRQLAEFMDKAREMLGPLWEREFDECLSECAMDGQCSMEEMLSGLLKRCQGKRSSMGKKMMETLLKNRPRRLALLLQYEHLLRKDPELQKLADEIGRGSGRGRQKQMTLEGQKLLSAGDHSTSAQRGEIVGSRESGDLFSLFPAELALFSDPETEPVFLKKMAEQRLQTYEYLSALKGNAAQRVPAREVEEEAGEKGPIIVCIDTSGSMSGERETYAKQVAYALARAGLEQGRPCRIINFSENMRVVEVGHDTSLQDLIDFLQHSFHGGTDPTAALEETLLSMQHSDFRWADLLMVSDFEMPPLRNRVVRMMAEARKRGNRFFALQVGFSASPGALKHFDKVLRRDLRSQ